MVITDVRVRLKDTDNKLKAIAAVTFDDEFVVKDIRVIKSDEGGHFIAMPCRKLNDGTYRDIAHPISQEARAKIERAILEEFDKVSAEEAAE